jgi:hypothetical protein
MINRQTMLPGWTPQKIIDIAFPGMEPQFYPPDAPRPR